VKSKKAALLALWFATLAGIVAVWARHALSHPMGSQFEAGTAERLILYGNLCALAAVHAICVQLLLMTRAGWIERVFGLDRLTRFHAVNGVWLFCLAVAHPVCVTLGNAQKGYRPFGEQLLKLIRTWPDIPQAAAGLLLLVLIVLLTWLRLRRRLRYDLWYGTHLAAYAAVLLAIGHQFENGMDLVTDRLFAAAWWGLYGCVAVHLIFYRWLAPFYLFFRHRFRVSRVVRETGDVVSIEITGRELERFPVRAGQFMFFRFLARRFWGEAHPFSLSCAPGRGLLRISCKNLGDYTARLPELKPGTPVVIDGPFGVFTAARAARPKILLAAGGIGITPLRSLAEEFAKAGKDVVLLYGNRSSKEIVFRSELEALAQSGRLKVVHVLSAEEEAVEKGYVDQGRIARLVPDCAQRDVYVCGPPPMMRGVLRALRRLGVPRPQIHHEVFSL
jgi:predicted ferric reductase